MIVAFSTSSPRCSVCVFERDGSDSWSSGRDAAHAAGGACLAMLEEALEHFGKQLESAELFLADLGPGSFTGTRVGVTLAKSLAHAVGVPAGGANSFDLISREAPVVIPSRRGEFFVRSPGQAPFRTNEVPPFPHKGYYPGLPSADVAYPMASEFQFLLDQIVPQPPERLVPAYLIEPSISIPKKPYGADVAR